MTPSPSQFQPMPSELVLQGGQFERIRDILARYSGVYLDQTSQRVLTTSLSIRLKDTGLSFDSYLSYVSQLAGHHELQQLSELVLNHETIFFRNQPHMRVLREVILPEIDLRKPPGVPLRIWSAGCSTGEEPYSLAIVALEVFGRSLSRPVEIWATDLSTLALEKAKRGCYQGRTLSNVTKDQRKRFFDYRSGSWFINDEVRELVHFEQVNLLKPFPKYVHGVDIIFCQNVTIYFELPTFRELVDRFYNILPEGGLLFLGFSETLWNIYDKFRLKEYNGAFLYAKEPKQKLPPAHVAVLLPEPKKDEPPHHYEHSKKPRSNDTRHTLHPSPAKSGSLLSPSAAALDSSHARSSMEMDDAIQRGKKLLDAGCVDEVLELLYKVPLNGAHAPKILALIARAHANRGDLDIAVAEARRAIALDLLTTDAYVLLGVLYARQGQLHIAAQQLERARYLEPDMALISFHLADVYRQLNRHDAAQREYRNTLHKLAAYPPDTLLDGVSVELLGETCKRYLTMLTREQR